MPYSEYRPDLMGSASVTPHGRIEAGSWQHFRLVYTAGRFGIDDTGSIKIAMRFATDFGPVQFDDPTAPGYTTVEASNGAELEYRWEFKRNIRPWSRALYIGVKKHFLGEGDTITVHFGNPSAGSPGVRVQTYCETAFEFRVFADPIATYDYVALAESPTISVVPGPPVTWRAVLPSLRRPGEPFRLAVKAEDAWGNPSDQVEETVYFTSSQTVDGLPPSAQFQKGAFALVIGDLSCDEPGDLTIMLADKAGKELCRSTPLRIGAPGQYGHFWGDLHGQSNETLGTNTAREYFLFALERAFLDVCSHQGNDFQITGEFWQELNELTRELDEAGRFVAIPGYEWSANTAVGGDRNVFYRDEGRPIYRSSHAQVPDLSDEENDGHDAHALFSRLAEEDCICWAHCGGRYADILYAHDPRLETAVEVHSSWGTFEWLLHDALRAGYRIGVVCNSDGHKGRVGASFPGASFFGAYGGLTCYLADELTRDAIFEAMRRRRHYGTTGTRLYLDVRAQAKSPARVFLRDPAVVSDAPSAPTDHFLMGDIGEVDGADIELLIDVTGSAPIERIDIFDGLDLVETVWPYDVGESSCRYRLTYSGAEYRGRARTTNWDGHLRLTGNRIESAEVFNNWNLDRGIQTCSADEISWKAVTTGNYGGIDFRVRDPGKGDVAVKTLHREISCPLASIGRQEVVYEAGGLDRRLTLQRLPETLDSVTVEHAVTIPLRRDGDTRLYVRVQQIDGHRAWSSPIYLISSRH